MVSNGCPCLRVSSGDWEDSVTSVHDEDEKLEGKACHRAEDIVLALHAYDLGFGPNYCIKPGVVAVHGRGSEIQPLLHSEFEANLGYRRPCLRNTKQRPQITQDTLRNTLRKLQITCF